MDAEELPRGMMRAAREQSMLVQALTTPVLQEYDLDYVQLQILVELDDAVVLSLGSLCDQLGLRESDLSYDLRRLEMRGLVQRQRSIRDRRAKQLRLTLDGRQLMDEVNPKLGEAFFRFMASMPRDIFEAVISGMYAMRLFMRSMTGQEVRLLPDGTVSSDQVDADYVVSSEGMSELVEGILDGDVAETTDRAPEEERR